jgi:two-component system, chemotaxis family, sensor kinase CheA
MSKDPYKYFRVEARELVVEIGKAVLALEKEPPSPARVAHLLRLAHTLKGAARVVRQREIADHAHALEDALAPHRETGGPLSRSSIDEVLALIDQIDGRVAALDAPPAATGEVPRTGALPVEEPRMLRTDVAEVEELLDGVSEVQSTLVRLHRGLAGFERVRQLAERLGDALERGLSDGADRRAEQAAGAAADLLHACRNLERGLGGATEQMDRQLREVRQGAERMRLVTAAALFTPLERAARDIAAAQGKRVTFEAVGGELRLDSHVLSVAQAALVQMVRNAVAHGIESEAERKLAGKPPAGRVRLEVVRRGRRVAFLCSDDGRGVDFEAVRRIAVAKGLVSGDQSRVGPDVLFERLLAGGISTSGTLSEMAGRGVGLDVVREAKERLGGAIAVRTEAGRGTAVELEVPLSVASLEAIHVAAGGQTYAIPLDAVRSTRRLTACDLAPSARGSTIVHDGRPVPFVPLARAVGGGGATRRPTAATSAVLVEGAGGLAAIGVDSLLSTGSIVLRPLPELCVVSAAVAGVMIDGDGAPRLVLDADGLVAVATQPVPEVVATQAARLPILVIDDSLTTRMLEQSILESAGYQVQLAVSAEDGLERAHRERFALFLVDVEMPGMDGFSFIERTQSEPSLRDIPAILVTSRNAPEDLRRGEQVGARGYMVKSDFNQVELLDRIRSLVG